MAGTINVALIGYAFMGKAHSNAYRQVTPFMSPRLTPRMKVLCGRTQSRVEAAARQYGWEEAATDWREVVARKDIDLVDISTPGDLHAEIAIEAARARQGGVLREAARQLRRRSAGDGRRRGRRRRRPHDLSQLPPHPRGDAGEGTDRGRTDRHDPPLPRHLPPGLDRRSRVPSRLAPRQDPGRFRRAR